MNTNEMTKLKEWWRDKQNKKHIRMFAIIFVLYGLYKLGYGLGTLLAHVGF